MYRVPSRQELAYDIASAFGYETLVDRGFELEVHTGDYWAAAELKLADGAVIVRQFVALLHDGRRNGISRREARRAGRNVFPRHGRFRTVMYGPGVDRGWDRSPDGEVVFFRDKEHQPPMLASVVQLGLDKGVGLEMSSYTDIRERPPIIYGGPEEDGNEEVD